MTARDPAGNGHEPSARPLRESLRVGREFRAAPRTMTRERMRWYVDAQATTVANDGRFHIGGPTIHDDDDYAVSQGLPGIIADGMVSTNWLFGLLIKTFGRRVLTEGRLSTKYIAPVYEDMVLICVARITGFDAEGGECRMDVWCETPDGRKVTVGEASVLVPND